MEPGCQVFGRERPDPGSGQFNGQRHSVEMAYDVGYRPGIRRVEGKTGSDQAGTVHEELYGLGFGQLGGVHLIAGREGEWSYRSNCFARYLECLTAGEQDGATGCRIGNRRDQGGSGIEDVLTIVENEKNSVLVERRYDPIDR